MPLAQLVQRNGGLLVEWYWDPHDVDGICWGHVSCPQRAAIVYFGGLSGGGGQGCQPHILFQEDDIPAARICSLRRAISTRCGDWDAQSGCARA